MTFLAKILASFLGLPRWVHLALAGAVAFALWLHFHDRAVIKDHEAEVTQATATASASASAAAIDAAAKTETQVEKDNAKARDAAARQPADPLRAGLDQLRRTQSAAKPAPR
jgi:hypothetical protein